MIDGLLAAVRTLTSIPVPGPDTPLRYRAVPWFVAVGGSLGGIHYLCGQYLHDIVPSLFFLSGTVLTALTCFLTGCLHLDGLADTADAFGNVHSREKTLDILKDPRKGTFGVAAIALALIWRAAAYQALIGQNRLWWLVPAFGLARGLQGLLLQVFRYARGVEGKAGGYRGPRWVAALVTAECVALIAVCCRTCGLGPTFRACIAGTVPALVVVHAYLRRVGGITGDCCGAVSEVFEVTFLAACAV